MIDLLLLIVFAIAVIQFNRNVVEFQKKRDSDMRQLHKLIEHNQAILNENKRVLNANSVEVYNVREAAFKLYVHWDNLADLISSSMYYTEDEDDVSELSSALEEAEQQTNLIINYFQRYFNMTPIEYSRMKVNRSRFKQTMRRRDGTSFNSEFSLN